MKVIKPIKAGLAMAVAGACAFQVQAQDGGGGQRLEEIVVTATRRDASMQDIPISISAFTENELVASGIQAGLDLGAQTPGLEVNRQSGAISAFVRGVGSLDVSAGQEGSVAIYIDGVFTPASYGNVFGFNNIERIEVLKGPQGTLFGRNATGGLVHIITKNPSHEGSVKGSVSVGNYDTFGGKLYATGGLTDTLAADISLVYSDQDKGWGKNIDTGNEVYTQEEIQARSKFLWTPTDALAVTATLSFFDTTFNQGVGKQFFPGATGLDGVTTYTGDWYDMTGLVDPINKTKGGSVSLQVDYKLNSLNLKSITAFQGINNKQTFDNDQTKLVIIDADIDKQKYRTLTQEFQVISDDNERLQWIAGVFLMKDEAGYDGPLGLGLFGDAFGGGGVGIKNMIDTESVAIFGEITYAFSDSTHLTAGLRFTRDRREISGVTNILSDWNNRDILMTIPTTNAKKNFNEPTYRLMLNHDLNDQMMVYGSYSRGFKSGNFNAIGGEDPPFDPEILDSYELGVKSDFFDNRLRVNAAIFYNDFQDIQLGIIAGPTIITVNAASAETYGAELEATALLTDNLSWKFGFSLLDTEIDYPDAVCILPAAIGSVQSVCDATGNELPRAPEFTFNTSPTLTIPLEHGYVDATLAFSYNDGFFWQFDNSRRQGSYELLNASLTWRTLDDRFSVRVFGNNLTESKYATFVAQQVVGDTFSPGAPRTYGVEFGFSL